MGKYKVEILLAAWQDIDRISDVYLRLAGAASAKKITDALLDTLARLGDFPYMGAQHPDPELARREFRKVLCGAPAPTCSPLRSGCARGQQRGQFRQR